MYNTEILNNYNKIGVSVIYMTQKYQYKNILILYCDQLWLQSTFLPFIFILYSSRYQKLVEPPVLRSELRLR